MLFFASRIAENANRRSRLIFQTPPHVPAPAEQEQKPEINGDTMHDFPRMPSWMENRENPFGPEVPIPPLMIPSISDSSDSLSDSKDDVVLNTPHSDESHDSRSEMERDTRDACHNSPTNMKPSVRPMPAILLAGYTSMPMLSTLSNGMLVNRIPSGMRSDSGEVTESVALPGRYVRRRSNRGRNSKSRSTSYRTFELSKVNIAQSPFDPFGDLSTNDSRGVSECSPVSDVYPKEDGNKADDERLQVQSHIDDVNSEDAGITAIMKDEDGMKEMEASKYLGRSITAPSKVKRRGTCDGVRAPPASPLGKLRRPRAVSCAPSIHHSFPDLRSQPTTLSVLETQSERGRSRPSTHTSARSASPISRRPDSLERGEEKKKAHLNGAAKQVQTESAATMESQRVSPDAQDGYSAPIVDHQVKQGQQQGSKEDKRFRKSMMVRIRKLGQRMKRLST